ncbi:MAG: cytochrome c3 family protein [Pirellulaceae bacterium]
MRKTIPLIVVAGMTLLLASSSAWADVPAPPVNQLLGFPDVGFGDLTEPDCRACHASGVPDRHHGLYGLPIDHANTLVPYPDSDGDGVDDPVYVCLSCHDQNFTVVRDCTVCHDSTSPHHKTAIADSGDCQACHGSIVDNMGDGHYIPTYAPSLVTPTRSVGDGLPLNGRGNGAGACNYCHDDDGLATPVILENHDLHHGTLFNNFGAKCGWCHDFGLPFEEQIRVCENCHGPDSLHNIQADSPNTNNPGTLVVGGEDAGYGHVGRDAGPGDSDCWGCHGFAPASAPGSGPIIPTIRSADVTVVDAGTATDMVLTGTGFTNIAGNVQFDCNVVLTAADGSSVTLTPALLLENILSLTIPADLAPGNYDLKAVKAEFFSNPAVISVIPAVSITEATGGGTVTITGKGFGGYAVGSGTTVTGTIGIGTVEATIVSWSDTTIVADFSSSPSEVTVNSVFGTAASAVGGGSGGDLWRVVSPSAEITVGFAPAGSFLSVQVTYPDGSSSMGLGIELSGVIFWMDITGNIFFGNIDRTAGTMSGVVFGPSGGGMFTGQKL